MIVYLCAGCKFAARVLGSSTESVELVGPTSQFWSQQNLCPACENNNLLAAHEHMLSGELLHSLRFTELEATECFAMLCGDGLPEEWSANATAVQEVFTSSRVKTVTATTVKGTTRSIIERIIFEDGTRMYLAASPHGAIVYRIARGRVGETDGPSS